MTTKGASLLPENHAGGGQIPDGDYLIKTVQCILHDYQGHSTVDVPAAAFLYVDDAGGSYEQRYKAGDADHLIPSEDGKRFVHPAGEAAAIYKGGAASQLLKSFLDAGFPRTVIEKADGDWTCFEGTKVTLTNKPAPVGKTGKKEESADKVFPLVSKIIALPGQKKPAAATRPTTARPAAAQPQRAATTPTTANGEPSELDALAIAAIQALVETQPDKTITRLKLGTGLMLALAKAKDPNMAAIKKLGTDAVWLQANAELGGWVTDGETISLPS